MKDFLFILFSSPLLAFNLWTWYVLWEESHPKTRFQTKTFYLSLGAYVLTIGIINDGIELLESLKPFAFYIKILLFLVYVFIAYLGYKKGNSKAQVEVV